MKSPLSIAGISVATLLLIGCGGGSGTTKVTVPQFTNASTQSVAEGSQNVLTIAANDDSALSYSIVGGDDADKFQIDPATGALSFKVAPDFENPADSDGNNTYIVTVQAVDADGNKATQTVTITVTNDTTDDGPAFTSANATSLKENRQLDFTVAADGAVAYSLGGEDQKRFALDETSHKLTFRNFLPDYERPSDANRDNLYKVDITATDDQNHSSRQTLTVTITNDTSDDAAEANWVHVYKTGADDGIVSGDPFGDDRDFSEEVVNGDRVVQVGERMWQDAPANAMADYDYFEAENYCNGLDYAGHSDWRVPNRHETFEIVNYGNSHSAKPTLDDIFQSSVKSNYWTREEVIGHSGNVLTNEAFVVNFRDGVAYALDRGTKSGVRCVRGKVLQYTQYIEKDTDDIYRDPKTGFMWAKPAGPESMYDAKARCESLVFGGYDDWRLPNISELHTVMPSVTNSDPGHPYGAEPLLRDGAHQLWSATKINGTDALYLDNYWNNNWGGTDLGNGQTVPVDANHPLGRDRMNDAVLPADNAASVFSICIRGGRL